MSGKTDDKRGGKEIGHTILPREIEIMEKIERPEPWPVPPEPERPDTGGDTKPGETGGD